MMQRIAISDIVIPPGRRDLHNDRVTDIADSMQKLGLLSPLGVRMIEGKPVLVFGRHRHAAAQRLGWAEVDCQILEVDDRRARMAEIAENLHRAELTALERSDQIAEWIRLVDQGISAQVAPKTGPGRPEGGISAATRELGINRDAARRAQTIAGLPEEAKAAAVDLGLDGNQSAMLKAAKSADPVGALQAHAREGGRAADESARQKAEREQQKPERVRQRKAETRRKAERDAAVRAVAQLLTDRLRPHEMRKFVENMRIVDPSFLDDTTLMTVMSKCRSDLFAWLDEEGEDHTVAVYHADDMKELPADVAANAAAEPVAAATSVAGTA